MHEWAREGVPGRELHRTGTASETSHAPTPATPPFLSANIESPPLGDIHCPTPYKFMGSGDIHGTQQEAGSRQQAAGNMQQAAGSRQLAASSSKQQAASSS